MTAIALKLSDLRVPDAVLRHWRAWVVLAAMAALWVAAGVSLAVQGAMPPGAATAARAPAAALRAAVPATAATRLKAISPDNALAWNASIPLSDSANPGARPFVMAASEADRLRSLDCLTAAIYYEAATEPVDGQRAVAQVILNRVRHTAYPGTVCGVVFEGSRRTTGCQFTFTCDGSLRRAPMASYWARARAVAEAALAGYVYRPVGWATHYHTNWVVPYWASSLVKAANVGTHIFYRWTGGWGRAPAFAKRYAGAEPAIAWRGGFGQPTADEVRLADARDAAAAEAAAEAAPIGSVDSFQRAVLRRYEPLRRDTANAMISERAGTDRTLTASQRWALTGDGSQSGQTPLGRRTETPQPVELQGVRYRPDAAPAPEAAPAATPPVAR